MRVDADANIEHIGQRVDAHALLQFEHIGACVWKPHFGLEHDLVVPNIAKTSAQPTSGRIGKDAFDRVAGSASVRKCGIDK